MRVFLWLALVVSVCLSSAHGLSKFRDARAVSREPWWERWLFWRHDSPSSLPPGYKWDEYLPRTSRSELRALEDAQAKWDTLVTEQELSYDPLLEPTEKWVLPFNDTSSSESVPWTSYNSSDLLPLLPKEIMWLLDEAEQRLRNASGIPFALATARRLAKFNSVAYCLHENIAAWNCTRCHGQVASMELGRTIYDEGWDLFAYTGYSPAMKAIIVAFKGTDSHSIYNWAENMHYWRTNYQVPFPGSEGASVHTGFFISYNSSALQPNVTESVGKLLKKHPEANLYIIGHSMGAAMAHVCILDMKFKFNLPKERLFLYTFGSPRIGNDIFAKFLREQVQGSIRVTHNRDIVPSLPPMWVGFHHVATEVWQVDVDVAHVLGICDKSGEDPLCHNSVCFLGMCTSVADHLLYLGAKMYHRPTAPC